MIQPLYILSASAISPQHSFEGSAFLKPAVNNNDGKLFVTDADYTQYISPVAIRRMSRLIKMGITTGMRCLELAGITSPDGIITGTARGSVTDMEHFLKDMISTDEGALNPTYFIQSTYNSVNGWLAMQAKSTCYNQTYVHRGFSFELALLDAQLLLAESNSNRNVLVGCFDELTPEYYIVKSNKAYWKKRILPSLSLLQNSDTTGTIPGEGAAFFTVSNEQRNSVCAVRTIQMLQAPACTELKGAVNDMLAQHSLELTDIDILLCGMNGDSRSQPIFDGLIQDMPGTTNIAGFKNLCGEYETSGGFALWLANNIFLTKQLPQDIIYRQGHGGPARNILICNNSMLNNVSLILVRATTN